MIIKSLLDNDLYNFTMLYFIYKNPQIDKDVKYKLTARKNFLTDKIDEEKRLIMEKIVAEIGLTCMLRFKKEELEFLNTIFQDDGFIEYLDKYIFDPNASYGVDLEGNPFLEYTGKWSETILLEVPALAIINEIMSADYNMQDYIEFIDSMKGKDILDDVTDFSTRRRMDLKSHEYMIQSGLVKSTSNVYLGMKYGLDVKGTMAHQALMAFQAIAPKIENFQSYFLKMWDKTFEGKFDIALTDTIGIDAFLADFPKELGEKYSGLRHDSGCPHEFTKKVLTYYEKCGINSKDKTLLYSDGLDLDTATEIKIKWKDKVNTKFGIGTNLVNHSNSHKWQNVIKMIEYNGKPVAKLSDTKGKAVCTDSEFIEYLRKIFKKD